jgi:hypothetical protein
MYQESERLSDKHYKETSPVMQAIIRKKLSQCEDRKTALYQLIAKEAKATPKPCFLESRVTLVSKCDRRQVQSRKLKGGIMAMAVGQKRSSRLNLFNDEPRNDKLGGYALQFFKIFSFLS